MVPSAKNAIATPPIENHNPNPSTKPQSSAAGVITELNTTVNRKKQKRRQKQAAARQAASQDQSEAANDQEYDATNRDRPLVTRAQESSGARQEKPVSAAHYRGNERLHQDSDLEQDYGYNPSYQDANGTSVIQDAEQDKKKNKSKKKKGRQLQNELHYSHSAGATMRSHSQPDYSHLAPPPLPPTHLPSISDEALRTVQRRATKDPIWDTSSQEERTRIKEFWLSLGEDERKSLVKIEKEAVLRKMKEQQKHSCSCTVCGRKRTAIEEELEVLYDAYYEELEQYANHNQAITEDGAHILPPSQRYSQTGRLTTDQMPPMLYSRKQRGRVLEELDDDEDDEEEDEDDLDGEEAEDDEYPSEDEYDEEDISGDDTDEFQQNPATDFFTFGNSLTVKGGILTVADDLLKNDGQKFIDMMEQLAERRMQREEIGSYQPYSIAHAPMSSQHNHVNHSHGPLPEEDDYDEEDDEDYDSQDEDYEEEDEMDTMTEEQRMEEGRRMFQIFAARMFEQRVLTAYREKVALERQEKLLEELAAESLADTQRDAKKARDAEKKKHKKQQQKQAKAEEKARKEEQKAAEEAAARDKEEKQKEEQRMKREEQRKKKEAERKALEEEKQRKEAEKQKRLEAERKRHEESERKVREQKAEEKKRREEARKKEREEKDAIEREAKEKKAHEEKMRKEKDDKIKVEKEAKGRKSQEAIPQQSSQTSNPTDVNKRSSVPAMVALPPSLKSRQSATNHSSPQVNVATPVIPKAPTPVRAKELSARVSQSSTPHTPETGPQSSKQSTPPWSFAQRGSDSISVPTTRTSSQHAPQPFNTQPPHSLPGVQPTMHGHPTPFIGMPPMGINGFPPGQAPLMHNMGPRLPPAQHMPPYPGHTTPMMPQPRQFVPGPIGAPPPGMAAPGMPPPPPRSYGADAHTIFPQHVGLPSQNSTQNSFAPVRESMASHSRHQSISNDENLSQAQATQPIARPAPIKRPASVKPGESRSDKPRSSNSDFDDVSNHLGSSALLGDDEPLPLNNPEPRRASGAPGMPTPSGANFVGTPFDGSQNYFGATRNPSTDTWRTPGTNFVAPGAGPGWGSSQPNSWSNFNTFQIPHRPANRPITVRILACQACKKLPDGFHDIAEVLNVANSLKMAHDPVVQISELTNVLDTEGNLQNGGGSFSVNRATQRIMVKWNPDPEMPGMRGSGLGLGEIGSPIPGHSLPVLGGLGARGFSS